MLSIQNKSHTLITSIFQQSMKRKRYPIPSSGWIRQLSSNKTDNGDKNTETTDEYLSSLGYDDVHVQNGMKDALKAAFGNNITVAHLKGLGKEGLSALSQSVIDQLKEKPSNAFVGIAHIQVPHHNFNFDLSIPENENFMTVALEGSGRELLHEYLECACGGNMSCATCHIILDEESYAKLDPPCEAECDMLDLAYEPTETSRLGCQVQMRKDLNGMTVTIPSGVNNFWS